MFDLLSRDNNNCIMTMPKAINRKKLVAFVLPIIRKEKLPMSEELEKLRHKQYVAERKLTAAKHKEKRLQSELKRLTRSERTHRLCTRAGMLETFLKEPTILTDEDVMELLTFIFQSEAVQKNREIKEKNKNSIRDGQDDVRGFLKPVAGLRCRHTPLSGFFTQEVSNGRKHYTHKSTQGNPGRLVQYAGGQHHLYCRRSFQQGEQGHLGGQGEATDARRCKSCQFLK